MTPDTELLKRYATERDEAAFAELVRRHLDHVYSTALRLVGGDAHLAEDVAQAVFTDLARKAGTLGPCPALSGWLHTSARFAGAKVVRSEQRRRQREQTSLAMSPNTPSTDPDWDQVRSLLDDAIGEMENADRDALLLRYFEKKPYAEVGAALGLTENAARMRVDRATEKLRGRLALRGITSTTTALGTALAQHAVCTAPAALGTQITANALAAAATSASAGAGAAAPGLAAPGKLALAGIGVAVVIGLALLLKPGKPAPVAAQASTTAVEVASAAGATARSVTRPPARAQAAAENQGRLELFFVDAQTGRAVTNRAATLSGWERAESLLVRKTVSLQEGRCAVPFDPEAGPNFQLYIHLEGYADTHVKWQPKQGDTVPEYYTVRLVRPARIGGLVVDAQGNPVAGATVGFNTENVSAPDSAVEDHSIDYLTMKTDAKGYWHYDRLAPEMVRCLYGNAWHPEHAKSETVFVSRNPELVQQLLEGKFVLRLREGMTVSGLVTDAGGHPLADASVSLGLVNHSESREVRTGADGRFQFAGCQAGASVLSAEAKGLAPAAVEIKVAADLGPVQLTLGPGKPLRARVVDTAGRPVPGACLRLDDFPRGGRSVPMPRVEYRGVADAEGRIEWTNAPDQDLEFDVLAPHYVRLFGVKLHPQEEEHVVTMQQALEISGAVRDAVTGALLPRFRLSIGWPERQADGSLKPRWTDIDRFRPVFTGGEFHKTMEEPVVASTSNPGYVFRFEAEGHAPFVTRTYQQEEGEVRLDIQLQPVEDIVAVAYTPDGQVAREAQVGLLTAGEAPELVPGGFAGDLGHALSALRRADADGRFTVPGDGSVQRVIIATPAGFAEATFEELRKARAVRLQGWERLEGTWSPQGQPVANATLRLKWNKPSADGVEINLDGFHATTDANGHFVFPQVPPGTSVKP